MAGLRTGVIECISVNEVSQDTGGLASPCSVRLPTFEFCASSDWISVIGQTVIMDDDPRKKQQTVITVELPNRIKLRPSSQTEIP